MSDGRKSVARGLALVGIALGVAELLAPRRVSRAAGLPGHASLVRAFGVREIASGIPLLIAKEPTPWLWGRVAGDALDAALLGTALASGDPARRKRALMATLAVAPIVALDLVYALKGRREQPRRSAAPVRYSDDVETIAEDEPETIEKIIDSLERLFERDREKFGEPMRVSHAKAHGAAVGELVVQGDLPAELRQGLFAAPGAYPVIVRLANVPGEVDSDIVGTQRGLAFKVLGVSGEMLPGHAGEETQDFVLDTHDRFPTANAKQFLHNHLLLEHMPQVPDGVKGAVSAASRKTNQALHAVGGDSAALDFFGHSRVHPLAEAYFSQAPIRYGDYVAKLAVVPVAPAQEALSDTKIDASDDPDALRTATVQYLSRARRRVRGARAAMHRSGSHAGRGCEQGMAGGGEPVPHGRAAHHSPAGGVQPRPAGVCRQGAVVQSRRTASRRTGRWVRSCAPGSPPIRTWRGCGERRRARVGHRAALGRRGARLRIAPGRRALRPTSSSQRKLGTLAAKREADGDSSFRWSDG